MSNPNKTVAAFRARAGRDPQVVEATTQRMQNDPMVKDMADFQSGKMTAEEFMKKWNRT